MNSTTTPGRLLKKIRAIPLLSQNAGSIGELNNNGTITGVWTGVYNNAGAIGTLTNNGYIGGTSGIYNVGGSIGTISNTGTITVSVVTVSIMMVALSHRYPIMAPSPERFAGSTTIVQAPLLEE